MSLICVLFFFYENFLYVCFIFFVWPFWATVARGCLRIPTSTKLKLTVYRKMVLTHYKDITPITRNCDRMIMKANTCLLFVRKGWMATLWRPLFYRTEWVILQRYYTALWRKPFRLAGRMTPMAGNRCTRRRVQGGNGPCRGWSFKTGRLVYRIPSNCYLTKFSAIHGMNAFSMWKEEIEDCFFVVFTFVHGT